MSGINLDVLSDEQWDELIAGCRTLRTLRDTHTIDQLTPSARPKDLRQPVEKTHIKEPALSVSNRYNE
jgi:hypothetical protein